jgi:hypothetical protein
MSVDASTAVTPRIAQHIQLHRTDAGVTLTIDGQPFPYAIGPDVVALWGDDGIAAVQITVHAERVELVDAEREADKPPAPEPVDVPAGIAQLLARIATTHPGVRYHPEDPNTAAIEYEGARLGLDLISDDSIPPRTIEGAAPVGR